MTKVTTNLTISRNSTQQALKGKQFPRFRRWKNKAPGASDGKRIHVIARKNHKSCDQSNNYYGDSRLPYSVLVIYSLLFGTVKNFPRLAGFFSTVCPRRGCKSERNCHLQTNVDPQLYA